MPYEFTRETSVTPDMPLTKYYNKGFVITRKKKGILQQIRSVRVDLSQYSPSSENRRILRKMDELGIALRKETLPYTHYSWKIHKLGKDFYDHIAGEGTFSATKIKEMFTNLNKSPVNQVIVFSKDSKDIAYCLIYEEETFFHYAFPFYDLAYIKTSLGIGMMTLALSYGQKKNKDYVYLGSLHTKSAFYKLQFSGVEWWNINTKSWSTDVEAVKRLVQK